MVIVRKSFFSFFRLIIANDCFKVLLKDKSVEIVTCWYGNGVEYWKVRIKSIEMSQPIISIICNTYNHEKFIKEALDSFLMQKIDVPIEVLVHDDASTDGTADIIREYERKYPDLIKPVYQTVNHYSRNVKITGPIQIARAKGKYIAFCEGDDYWTDPEKLQIQYNFMEQHPEYSACCHAYNMVRADGSLIKECWDFPQDMVIPMKRLIGNQLELPQFATLFARKSCLEGYQYQGEFLGISGDVAVRLCCATQGDVSYLNRNMSCYRRFSEGSWTNRIGKDSAKFAESLKRYIPFLEKLNEYTNGEYSCDICEILDERMFLIDLLENRYRDARKRVAFRHTTVKRKIYIAVGCACPWLVNRLRSIRQ